MNDGTTAVAVEQQEETEHQRRRGRGSGGGVVSAHTPGPWKFIEHPAPREHRSHYSVGHGANGMASVAWMTMGAPSARADAALIAAAPEQHEALALIVRGAFLERLLSLARRYDREAYESMREAVENAHGKAVAAVAKAVQS